MAESARELIGRRVREERERAGFTNQAEFAIRVGLDAPTLSRMEHGKRSIDSLVLQRIADELELTMDVLVKVPSPQLALARQGDADDEAMQEMVAWATHLLGDIDTVAKYVGRRPLL